MFNIYVPNRGNKLHTILDLIQNDAKLSCVDDKKYGTLEHIIEAR